MHSLVLDQFPDALLLANDERRYINANAPACSLLRRSKDQLLGSRIEDVLPLPAEVVSEMWSGFLAAGASEGELLVSPGDGGEPILVDFRARANIVPGVHIAVIRPTSERSRMPVDLMVELIAIQKSALAHDVSLEKIMQTICVRATALVRGEGAAIELHERDAMVYHVTSGSMAPFLGLRVPVQGSLSGLALRSQEVLLCDDSETDERVDRVACRRVGARSMIVVPLVNDGAVVGVLKVTSRRAGAFDAEAVETLRLMAGFLATAMVTASASEARRARLADLERLRDEMTALLVHDMRNPITAILTNLAYIQAELPDTNTEAIGAAIDALNATMRLERLTRTLLETAKLEHGRFELQPEAVTLRSWAKALIEPRASAARQRSIAIKADAPEGLVATLDRQVIERVCENILDNAFRYAPDGGRIELAITPCATGVVVRIGNTGTPIAPEDRARLFEKYEQAGTTRRENFGLGLYFCKLAVDAHGGSIWIESTPELATIFAFELPSLAK
jgi:signal transduction histidine kinase